MSREPGRWPEHDYIAQRLPTKGHTWVANKIGRNPAAVWAYADRHGIRLGEIDGWTRITTLANATGRAGPAIWNRAKADGVLRRVGGNGGPRARICLVPNQWADEFLHEAQAKTDGNELREHEGWLTVYELADLWSVGRSTITRGLNGMGTLAPLLKGARTARGHTSSRNGMWLVHPEDATVVARRLEADRRKARVMVSTKSLSIEHGVKQSYAADIGRELGGELLFVHGRLMCHVTQATAEIMRRRFTEGITPGRRRGRPKKPQELRRAA